MSGRMNWDKASKRDRVHKNAPKPKKLYAWYWIPLKWPAKCSDNECPMVGLVAWNPSTGEKLCELCAQNRRVDIKMSARAQAWLASQS